MGPYDYANFQAPQANPSPAAYGPYDVGIHPYLMQLAGHLAQMGRQRQQDKLAALREQHYQDISGHYAANDAARAQAEATRAAVERARYEPAVETTPGEMTEKQVPSLPISTAAPLFHQRPTALTPPTAMGALGLGSFLSPGDSGVEQETRQVQGPPTTTVTPSLAERELAAKERLNESLMGYRQGQLGQLGPLRTAEAEAATARAEQARGKGQMTAAQRAEHIYKLLNPTSMMGPVTLPSLSQRESYILQQAQHASTKDLSDTISDPKTSQALRAYLTAEMLKRTSPEEEAQAQ